MVCCFPGRHLRFRPAKAGLSLLPALALAAAGALTAPDRAAAQEPLPDQTRMASVNPALLVFTGIFSVDFEQTVSSGMTVGPTVYYHHAADRRYAPNFSADAVFRYYPSGRAFSGLAVGALTGFTVMDDGGVSRNAMGLGFTVENHWLLGTDERLVVALGAGGKRLFYFSERGRAWRALPMVRASLGWTF